MDYNYEAFNLDNKIIDKLNHLELSYKKDNLTGLWNQSYLSEQVNNFVGGERNAGNLFVIDIDDFSKINSEYGHIMGDAYLVKLAGIIKDSFRERDVVARFSGDEFAVFLLGNLTFKDIENISTKLIESAIEAFVSMNNNIGSSISIGISRSPVNGSDFLTLYRKADEALRKAKKSGKNCYRIADEANEGGKQVTTEADMRIVKILMRERNGPFGALNVEYDGFKSIYRFMSRFSDRRETDIAIVLFTVYRKDGGIIDPVTLSEAMYDLENMIKLSLRMGDVSTKYSSCQYLVMLTGSKSETAMPIAERVLKNYSGFTEKYGILLKYDVDNV